MFQQKLKWCLNLGVFSNSHRDLVKIHILFKSHLTISSFIWLLNSRAMKQTQKKKGKTYSKDYSSIPISSLVSNPTGIFWCQHLFVCFLWVLSGTGPGGGRSWHFDIRIVLSFKALSTKSLSDVWSSVFLMANLGHPLDWVWNWCEIRLRDKRLWGVIWTKASPWESGWEVIWIEVNPWCVWGVFLFRLFESG